MGPFSYLRSIYSLDTLDTRFTNPTSVPYKPTSNNGIDSSKKDDPAPSNRGRTDRNGQPVAEPSKWNTLEFYVYYLVFIVTVPYMFWIAYDVSRPSDPNYVKYKDYLSPGWIPGRKIDLTDAQYSSFRRNIPYLSVLVVVHPLLRRLYNAFHSLPSQSGTLKINGNTSTAEGDARLSQRASWDFLFAVIFLCALHGFSALKVILILVTNFFLATSLPRNYIPVATWIFNISILFSNELCRGYRFEAIADFISPAPNTISGESLLHEWGRWLDRHGGIMSRWEVLFNITVLRLISFNMDYYWSLNRRAGSPIEKKQLDPSNLSERDRISIPADAKNYSFRNYFAYAIYAPLYLTGPIMTFNEYISQAKYAPRTIETSRTIKYGIRFFLVLLCMEVLLHFDYCVVISKAHPNWSDYTPAQISMLAFFNLHVIWLKLLIPWRFFRLWALIDGMDPPENMVRCVSNNPSPLAFWRGWHKSYNRWLIRYIYVPLGGSSSKDFASIARSILNYLAVFTFVALWHDINLNLLIWGWLVVLFMLPEVIGGYLFPKKKWQDRPRAYQIIRGFGVTANILLMMTANLVGFAVGVDGLKSIISSIFNDYHGLVFLVTAILALFVGVQVMFEIRESEKRRGIFMKC
ncbi:glycerol:H+ symporter-like protein [Xylogone sp. PMI_703]|nr:glycerol:H+ symporter-like protein [Xylogone sp. PMI_703]